MRIVKSTIARSLFLALSFLFVVSGCDHHIDVDYGPCKFAPPESKFSIFPRSSCNECYFNLEFRDKEYSFSGNQFETGSGGSSQNPDKRIVFTQIQNVFFSFYLVSPPSDEALSNSINVKTPLLKVDTLSRLEDYPPPVSVSFGIANYCKDFFEPITDDINQSYHQLTDIKLIESYYVGSIEGSIGEYQKHIYYCHGNIHATFIINGDPELVTATYKLTADIYEKL